MYSTKFEKRPAHHEGHWNSNTCLHLLKGKGTLSTCRVVTRSGNSRPFLGLHHHQLRTYPLQNRRGFWTEPGFCGVSSSCGRQATPFVTGSTNLKMPLLLPHLHLWITTLLKGQCSASHCPGGRNPQVGKHWIKAFYHSLFGVNKWGPRVAQIAFMSSLPYPKYCMIQHYYLMFQISNYFSLVNAPK